MTRYTTPLPHNPGQHAQNPNGQLPPGQVPPSQGRPAGAAQHPQYSQHPHHQYAEPEMPGWPAPSAAPRGQRPGPAGGYGAEPSFGHDPRAGGQPHDPYAALRPDGYGPTTQPPQPSSDPYGLAGYTAPPSQAPQGYSSRQQQPLGAGQPSPLQAPSYEPYPAAGDTYANGGYDDPLPPGAGYGGNGYGAPQTAHGLGATQHGFGAQPASPAQHAPSYGGGFGGAQPQAPSESQWGAAGLALDPRDYQGHATQQGYGAQPEQWGADPYAGEAYADPAAYGGAGYQGAQPGAQHASFDQSYAEDEAQYEDEPRGGGWKKALALMGCMVLVGGTLVVGYGTLFGSGGSGEPTPLVKGERGPAKVKPSEPGGKKFDHTDSKIMGRLGENQAAGSDPAGVRKVPVVAVGPDGSIRPPETATPEDQTRAVVAVPGLTVIDGLETSAGPTPNRTASPGGTAATPAAPKVQMLTGAESKAAATPAKQTAALADADEPKAVPAKATTKTEAPKKKESVAAATPAATGPRPTGAGYVAVLASVPASDSSRINALTQFADMQQKYGTILNGKTPDIQEANLGEKGTYHRLLVGPPGSRDAANSVCSQLKAEGYSGCWVTAY